jgi:sulfur-carrier protein adenylyltransferase/sulfurtransferase
MKNKNTQERYQRQVTLKGFGEAAQHALLQANVLVIGAGGLGCPVLQYLTAAGVGCIGIVDNDVVSVTNLHRQILYDTNDIGKSKVAVAAAKLRQMNPDTKISEYNILLDKNNCLDIINQYDVIIDCTDNFAARYMINDACVLREKSLVFAAVNRFEGQVAVFNVSKNVDERTGNYRDLFPVQPAQNEVMNCAEAGVLGVLPGIIGSMQANEAIKLITGIGKPLVNQLLTYNALNNSVNIFEYHSSKPSAFINSEADFYKMNYEDVCVTGNSSFEIDADQFDGMLLQKDTTVIDVREPHELPLVNEFEHIKISLSSLKNTLTEIKVEDENNIIFFCQSGIRSLQAAALANDLLVNKKNIYSLRGGIVAWKKLHVKQLT